MIVHIRIYFVSSSSFLYGHISQLPVISYSAPHYIDAHFMSVFQLYSAVYEHILAAAAATNRVPLVLFRRLAKFISSFPRELLQQGGNY